MKEVHEFLGEKWIEVDQDTWMRQTNGKESSEMRVMFGFTGRYFVMKEDDFPFENEGYKITISKKGDLRIMDKDQDVTLPFLQDASLELLIKAVDKVKKVLKEKKE